MTRIVTAGVSTSMVLGLVAYMGYAAAAKADGQQVDSTATAPAPGLPALAQPTVTPPEMLPVVVLTPTPKIIPIGVPAPPPPVQQSRPTSRRSTSQSAGSSAAPAAAPAPAPAPQTKQSG